MDNKTIQALEYNKILELLKKYATCEPGKTLCEKLKPSSDFREVVQSQKETSAALDRIRIKGSLNFGNVRYFGESFKRLALGSPLNIPELMHIRLFLENTSRAYNYGKHNDNHPAGCHDKNAYDTIKDTYVTTSKTKEKKTNKSNNYNSDTADKGYYKTNNTDNTDDIEEFDAIDIYFSSLKPLTQIKNEIARCILSETEISDNASPRLFELVKQHKNVQSKMHTVLQSLLESHKEYLMDSIITMKDGAYCLPIRADFKNKVSGIVHDHSASGSTIFIEPMAVIRFNNELREIEIEKQQEIDNILEDLSSLIRPYIDDINENIKNMAHLDFVYAKAHLSDAMSASMPVFNDRFYINIKEGRHPLIPDNIVVPINISIGDDYSLLVITGPNTGGKTVSLKTVGLFTLMGQSGLHIPAFEGSSLPVFKNVYADIGDEQSIEQSLSTFSGHMKNIVDIIKKADRSSLCLFDELGAGTDPAEGAALAIALLSHLHKKGATVLATSHYSELKIFALNTPGIENACCEFNVETLRPTYRIIIGIPGKSNAFAISRKLGLPEYIIDEAKKNIEDENMSFEEILTKIEHDRFVIENEKKEINNYKAEIEKLKQTYEKKNSRIQEIRENILEKARLEAENILSLAKETADTTINNINKLTSAKGIGSELEKEREKLRESLKKLEKKPALKISKKNSAKKPKHLRCGDSVYVHSMNLKGTVSSLPNDKGKLYVQMGILRSQVSLDDIELIDDTPADNVKVYTGSKGASLMKASHISPEINVIGMNVDEACSALDKYLDDALLSHLKYVRIIHGRGTGALQKGIHAYLKKQPYIKSYHLAEYDDGGNAVTIVNF